jgi:hypothetical protein
MHKLPITLVWRGIEAMFKVLPISTACTNRHLKESISYGFILGVFSDVGALLMPNAWFAVFLQEDPTRFFPFRVVS